MLATFPKRRRVGGPRGKLGGSFLFRKYTMRGAANLKSSTPDVKSQQQTTHPHCEAEKTVMDQLEAPNLLFLLFSCFNSWKCDHFDENWCSLCARVRTTSVELLDHSCYYHQMVPEEDIFKSSTVWNILHFNYLQLNVLLMNYFQMICYLFIIACKGGRCYILHKSV